MNRKSAQNRKASREKRPSMISEMYTTGVGTRMRGSYGNIHNYHGSRTSFGANRAVSLDQYSTHNRRSSDGLQQVSSDNNVHYHHHHPVGHAARRSAEHSATPTIAERVKLKFSGSGTSSPDAVNRNLLIDDKVKVHPQQQFHGVQLQHKYSPSNTSSNASSEPNSNARTFMSRLRQFTGRFAFSFDRDQKRGANNNSHETRSIAKNHICCAKKVNLSPQHNANNELMFVPAPHPISTVSSASGRNRAYSLDVPTATRYSSSNSGGDSRKSSRDDNNHFAGLIMSEDNNSNHTTIGDNRSGSEGVDSVAGDSLCGAKNI